MLWVFRGTTATVAVEWAIKFEPVQICERAHIDAQYLALSSPRWSPQKSLLDSNFPGWTHFTNNLINLSNLDLLTSLMALFGIPSRPGAFSSPSPLQISSTSWYKVLVQHHLHNCLVYLLIACFSFSDAQIRNRLACFLGHFRTYRGLMLVYLYVCHTFFWEMVVHLLRRTLVENLKLWSSWQCLRWF